ncbi:MAG TPA: MarR family winged helix-turn-helix transcriptional regulator [Bryobacteraceae bacterium]|nr:MarR family winged helix-turn-helix transcriptional regulator [Bryobacteraceae bacterium]
MIDEFLGSANVLASAISGLMEERLLTETTAKTLTLSQLKILKLLASSGQGTIGDLAAFLGVSNPAASKAVEKLVRRRLVRRTEDALDRRSSAVTLSEAARRMMADYESARRRRLTRLFRDISAAELRRTAGLLERLSARIVTQGAHPEEVCLQCGIHLGQRCLVREAANIKCSYEQRRSKSKGRTDVSYHDSPAAANEIPAGSGSTMGPPRQRAARV